MPGPLTGVRIIEIAGIGPAPMACMLLADMGATVLRVTRPDDAAPGLKKPVEFDFIMRGRKSVAINLKHTEGQALILDLCERADGLIEGFRPGTMERLGLGPEPVLLRSPALVYGRMTGFGQTGPLAQAAGHDINYIALTGALHAIGDAGGKPVVPLNLLGDFGGGSLYLAFGMVCALLEARASGQGQVVDAAIVDGTSSLMTMIYGLHAAGMHTGSRGENLLDGGSAIYGVYACADGEYVSIGPIETKFRAILFEKMGLPFTAEDGPTVRAALEARFLAHDRRYWCDLLEGTDACFAPVLPMSTAALHDHSRARDAFVSIDGQLQPAPAPRFSRSRPDLPTPPEAPGTSGREALSDWGIAADRIDRLIANRAMVLPA